MFIKRVQNLKVQIYNTVIFVLCCHPKLSCFKTRFLNKSCAVSTQRPYIYFEGVGKYIIILIINNLCTMKIGTYSFDTRGHTHRNLILKFKCHIHFLTLVCCMSQKKKKHAWTLIHRVGELAKHDMNKADKD